MSFSTTSIQSPVDIAKIIQLLSLDVSYFPASTWVLWNMLLSAIIVSSIVADLCVISIGNGGPMCIACSLFIRWINSVPLVQCFPNCGAVDPCVPPGGLRDPLTSAHHVCCNSSFVILDILIHLITFVLPFWSRQFILVYVAWHKGSLFNFLFIKGSTQKASLGSPALVIVLNG